MEEIWSFWIRKHCLPFPWSPRRIESQSFFSLGKQYNVLLLISKCHPPPSPTHLNRLSEYASANSSPRVKSDKTGGKKEVAPETNCPSQFSIGQHLELFS